MSAARANRVHRRGFFRSLFHELIKDDVDDTAAMMAYYAVLAVFPMLVFTITVAMLVVPSDTIRDGVTMATTGLPTTVRGLLVEQVTRMEENASTGFALGSAAVALWGASRGASSLAYALNRMYGKEETRPWLRRQLTALAVTLAVALIIVLALVLLAVGPWLGDWLTANTSLGPAFDVGWAIGRWVGAGVMVMLVWAMLYRYLSNTDAPFRVFTPGAAVGVALWLGVSALFGLYLQHWNSYDSTYGTLGGVIIFLTWLWLSNLALLVGAEINDVLADLRRHRSKGARQLADEGEALKTPTESPR